MQVYEGGRDRTCDLGIKSPQAIPRHASQCPVVPQHTPTHSYATKPEATAKVGSSPTEIPTAIPLTKGAVALVDPEDYERLARHRWHLQSAGYAARTVTRDGRQRMVLMHREVLGATDGVLVDHRDGDRLNNTRKNLRFATHRQNSIRHRKFSGRSQYRGVSWMKSAGKWRAEINHQGQGYYLGLFTTEEDAAREYDKAALGLHCDFARLNFPVVAKVGPRPTVCPTA